MSKLIHGKHEYDCPGTWNELSFPQLIQIMNLQLRRLSLDDFLMQAALILFEVKGNMNKQWFFANNISDDDTDSIMLFGEFLTESGKLNKNPAPVYQDYRGLLKWNQLELLEWVLCEGNYVRFAEKGDEESLNKLVAILYRAANTVDPLSIDATGDEREPFNSNNVEARARVIAEWPKDVRLVILTFYEGIRAQVNAALPKGGKKRNKNANYGQSLLNMMHGLSNNDLTKLEEIAKTKLPVVISQLNKNLEDASESK